jgi:hypothetical protein
MNGVRSLVAALLLLGPAMLQAQAGLPDAPEANPSRPTVSTPATLTPVAYLQFENGVLYATDSPEFSKRLGVNQVTKLSINERMEVLALFEPFTHSNGAAVSGNRPGEVFPQSDLASALHDGVPFAFLHSGFAFKYTNLLLVRIEFIQTFLEKLRSHAVFEYTNGIGLTQLANLHDRLTLLQLNFHVGQV